MSAIVSKKICMLGDFSVGKTSLIRRFVEQQFSDRYLSTVGVKISRKTVQAYSVERQNQVNVQMLIWDLEGNTKFKTITPMYLQGASSAVVVADINRPVTINHIPDHIRCFLSINPKGYIIIALNKADLSDKKTTDIFIDSIASEYPEKIIGTYFTSAKTGLYVDEIFQKLAYQMLNLE